MELTEVIEKRRSIRKFSDKPVSRGILEELIKAAALAPTASNLQAWRFFVADDPKLVRDIDSFSPGLSGKPPVIIAIASDLAEVERRGSKNSLVYGLMMDASMAAENLMLKAADLGLGTCAIKSYNDKAVHKLLNLPDTMRLEILISLGWPEGEPRTPKRKPMEEVLFWNAWEEQAEEAADKKPEKEADSPSTAEKALKTATPAESRNSKAEHFNKKELQDLLIYMITSAAGLPGEPQMYGPLRLIESSRRLAGMLGDAYGGAVFGELTALIDAGKGKNMTDPEGFCEMLGEAAAQATDLLSD
ncbi:MAG: DUF6092 family protein [Eubacteriales bacterium]